MRRMFSPKEKEVFAAVQKLLAEGRPPYAVTVKEIADKAGMGKGTLYEYFRSKEEILAGAVLYSAERILGQLYIMMAQPLPFYEKLDALLRQAGSLARSEMQGIEELLDSVPAHSRPALAQRYQEQAEELLQNAKDQLAGLIAQGKEEGEIGPGSSEEYCGFCLNAAFAHYSGMMIAPCAQNNAAPEDVRRQYALTMLRRAWKD